MERMTSAEAAKELNMTIPMLTKLMQMEKLPIGYAFIREGKTKWNYVIYKGLVEQYKRKVVGNEN